MPPPAGGRAGIRVKAHRAILLLGPTGSGKTPLGDWLQQHGLWGRRCFHFDFGRELRRVAAGKGPPLGPGQAEYVRHVLKTGELLDDEHFGVAESLLQAFIAGRAPGPYDLLVLTGLPRHVGQAEALAPALDVAAVVRLSCPPEIAVERIRTNAGGDRSGRPDDDAAAVGSRLARFERRTAPLVQWYRRHGATVCEFDVKVTTTPADVAAALVSGPPQR
jgi:adenylate kinase